jgi:pyruvate dehydrogenase E1 component alpha subunit
MNKEELIAFEKQVADLFNDGKIRSPVHLSGGNEKSLIRLFERIKPDDWIFTTYRSHYHALLKGVDKDWLIDWIKQNKSIHLMNKEHKIVSSAIVGGTLSQAVGAALAIKLKYNPILNELKKLGEQGRETASYLEKPHVWCFCGDMTASLGIFKDCLKYSYFNELPIHFIVEDNGLSTDTPTKEAWGCKISDWHLGDIKGFPQVKIIKYQRTWPHYGAGKMVNFT